MLENLLEVAVDELICVGMSRRDGTDVDTNATHVDSHNRVEDVVIETTSRSLCNNLEPNWAIGVACRYRLADDTNDAFTGRSVIIFRSDLNVAERVVPAAKK